MTHRGPFQPLLFCDSVILWTVWECDVRWNEWDTSEGADAALYILLRSKRAEIKACKMFPSNHKSMTESTSQETLGIQISVMNYSHHCLLQSSLFPSRATLGYLTMVVWLHLAPQEHYLQVMPPHLSQLPKEASVLFPYWKLSVLVPACFNAAWECRH